MPDRLKRGLSLIAAGLLYLVGLAPEEGLWSIFARVGNSIVTHPLRAAAVLVVSVILFYSFKDEVLDLFGFYSTKRLGAKIQHWIVNIYKKPLMESEITNKDFKITTKNANRILTITKGKIPGVLSISSAGYSLDSDKPIIAAASPLERFALKEEIFLEMARMSMGHIQVGDKDNVFSTTVSYGLILDKDFDQFKLMKGIEMVDRAQGLAEKLYQRWIRTRRGLPPGNPQKN